MSGIEFLKNKKMKNVIWASFIFAFSFLSVFFFCCGEQQMWQNSKDLGFYRGTFFFLILIFVIRMIPIRKLEVWITLVTGLVGLFIYHAVMNVSPATYGVNYFRVILFKRLSYVLFAALIVDVIRNVKVLLKQINIYWGLFVIFALWASISTKNAFPLMVPTFALLTTSIDKDKRSKILELFLGAYYLVFLYMIVLSFVKFRDVWSEPGKNGRFIGAFLSESTATMFCGGALLIGLYFVARYFFSKEKRVYKLIVALILTLIPIYPVYICGSRSCLFGVIFALLIFFIFIVGKKDKISVLLRVGGAALVVVLMIGTVLIIANGAAKQIRDGEYKPEEHGYLYNHIVAFANPDARSGYFGEDSVLNVLDAFASERLKIWHASLKLVEPFGKPFTGIYIEWNDWGGCSSPHSFFIWMLVTYGAIGGAFMFIWFLGGLGFSVFKCLKGEWEGILPALWFAFCIGPFGGVTMYWQASVAVILLIIQYPLCFRKSEM